MNFKMKMVFHALVHGTSQVYAIVLTDYIRIAVLRTALHFYRNMRISTPLNFGLCINQHQTSRLIKLSTSPKLLSLVDNSLLGGCSENIWSFRFLWLESAIFFLPGTHMRDHKTGNHSWRRRPSIRRCFLGLFAKKKCLGSLFPGYS